MSEQRFRNVLRGYDPIEVDAVVAKLQQSLEDSSRDAGEATVAVTKLESQVSTMQSELARARQAVATLRSDQESAPAAPTFADLGQRIGSMLTLAQEESQERIQKAHVEAGQIVSDAQREAEVARNGADRYASDVSSKADAEGLRLIESARRQANDILDHADREASARRGEAEAYFEEQQARSAAAAADFEQTLAVRRDKASADFATQMEQQEQALAAATEQRAAVEADAQTILAEAKAHAETVIANSQQEASTMVEDARLKADRIRRETERELAAITARRDSINTQLANVRQMLATLGGNVGLSALIGEPVAVPQEHPLPSPVDMPAIESQAVQADGVDVGYSSEHVPVN